MPHHGVRFHNVPGGGAVGGEGAGEVARAAPELSLSSLEYYLFTFAWVRGTVGVERCAAAVFASFSLAAQDGRTRIPQPLCVFFVASGLCATECRQRRGCRWPLVKQVSSEAHRLEHTFVVVVFAGVGTIKPGNVCRKLYLLLVRAPMYLHPGSFICWEKNVCEMVLRFGLYHALPLDPRLSL